MAYQHSKDHSAPNGEISTEDPMMILMAKLTGTSLSKPRQPIPYNLWAKEDANREAVDREFKVQRSTLKSRKGELLTLRTKITKDLYDKLPETTKQEWRKRAKDIQGDSLRNWKETLEGPPSTEPADRQR